LNRRAWIAVVVVAALIAVGLVGMLWMRGRIVPPPLAPTPPPVAEPEPEEPPERLDLEPADFAALPGWEEDAAAAALPAFLASCAVFDLRPGDQPLAAGGIAGTHAPWHDVCRAAAELPRGDDAAARAFFEERFAPWTVSNRGDEKGLFTGYYEPTLHGSRRRGGRYRVALYARPPELVAVDLGEFRDDLAGRRIAGRVVDGRLVPMPDRREIETGAFTGRGLEVVWVDDPVDAFFLHIQGSGVVRLEGGGELRLGYAGQNGHPYRAIGRDLVERGHMEVDEVSMQSIRTWLAEHPEAAAELMNENPSYVFFRRLDTEAPLGAQGVELTPGRSLAVDTRFHALGVPVFLDTTRPAAEEGGEVTPLRRLMVAQDTGGAIRGPVRGDVFWGPGDEAAAVAGRMREQGHLWLLLPREVEPPPAAAAAP
jgi:membrane-bound lytic murein transglycosylase A